MEPTGQENWTTRTSETFFHAPLELGTTKKEPESSCVNKETPPAIFSVCRMQKRSEKAKKVIQEKLSTNSNKDRKLYRQIYT